MNKEDLQQAILRFIPSSSLSDHQKSMIQILLPGMTDAELGDIYNTLKTAHDKMAKLNEKEKRVEFTYKMMIDGLTKAKSK